MFISYIFSGFPEYMLESQSVKVTRRFCLFARNSGFRPGDSE